MNRPCPRCGQNLIVDERGPATVTCPRCLASVVTGSKPLPAPPLPMRVIPLNYAQASGDVEAELAKDLQWAMYGIGTFAAGSIMAFLVLIVFLDVKIPAKYWVTGVALVTSLVACFVLGSQRRRKEKFREGLVRFRSTSERLGSLVALGVGGIVATGVMLIVTGVVIVVLFLATCFGVKW
jgi:hypothetical protein